MEPKTLADVFTLGAEQHPRPDRFLRKIDGVYQPVSTEDFVRRVRACAGAMSTLGIARGDRVAILSYNRLEWAVVDYASHLLGAVTVPIYTTLPADACGYILENSGARAIFVESAEQAAKVSGHPVQIIEWSGFDQFLRGAREFTPVPLREDDLATLIYTSGTTGVPKGVMLSHKNLVSNLLACCEALTLSADDSTLSFLPLSHIFERLLDYALYWKGAPIAYAESMDKVAENMRETSPTILAAVPRFYEKMRNHILETVQAMSPRRRALFEWARRVGAREAEWRTRGAKTPLLLRAQYALARALVFDKVAARVGGRVRMFVSGGAALSKEVAEFFFSLGFTVLEGYGLTETSPVLCVNRPGATRLGTVGQVIPGVEVKIASDGEILARGPNIMMGYYQKPEETAQAIKDGWFYTGDIGELDADGYLRITDRKKDLLKTSGGKYIAPQAIENRLKSNPCVANAMVVADQRRFPAALIVAAPGCTREQLQAHVDAVNKELAPYEQIKKFAMLEKDFTIENGEMTATLKIRRRIIEERYRAQIDALYTAEAPPKSKSV